MPPRSGKLYLIQGSEDLEEIYDKLDGFSVTEKYEDGGFTFDLITDIQKVSAGENHVSGIYCYDYVTRNYHRSKIMHTPITQECPFRFGTHGNSLWLLVMVSKDIANRVAIGLGGICNLDVREGSIYSREMNHFIKLNDKTKVVFFDEMDIPGVDKSSLYGNELVQTELFSSFAKRGTPKWVVTEAELKGYTVGVGGDVGVTIYNNVETKDYVEFVEDEILPLVFREVKPSNQQTLDNS